MAKRIEELSRIQKDRLSQALIAPVGHKSKAGIYHVRPRSCYLGESEDYRETFDFVDFGEEANLFLLAVRSQREPTKLEIAPCYGEVNTSLHATKNLRPSWYIVGMVVV
jgi:Protein of unknown function (DUF3684)